MRALKKRIEKKIQSSRELLDFQSLQMEAYYGGEKVLSLVWGPQYLYYDWASLTKIVFTTSVLMNRVEEGKIQILQGVSELLPWYPHKKVSLAHLLNHSAGYPSWSPFYKELCLDLTVEEKFQQVQRRLRWAPRSRRKKSLYSDLDFYLLGAVMEKIDGKPLIEIWKNFKKKYFPKTSIHFNYANKLFYSKKDYAPTEDCPWRKKVLQGQVHDENAWSMGGVAPHAGLFGSIGDLSQYGLRLREIFLGQDFGPRCFTSSKILRRFASWSRPQRMGDWGYGFMKPSKKNSSAGDFFSPQSFGHTGFTGTSLWWDPDRDLLVCLLSNRVYPSRQNQGFVHLRPLLHNWLIQGLMEEN